MPSSATSKALASRMRIAASGSASCETCEPNWLIVCADQSLRKSGCRQRPPRGQTRMSDGVVAWRERLDDTGERRAELRSRLVVDRLRHVAEVPLR